METTIRPTTEVVYQIRTGPPVEVHNFDSAEAAGSFWASINDPLSRLFIVRDGTLIAPTPDEAAPVYAALTASPDRRFREIAAAVNADVVGDYISPDHLRTLAAAHDGEFADTGGGFYCALIPIDNGHLVAVSQETICLYVASDGATLAERFDNAEDPWLVEGVRGVAA